METLIPQSTETPQKSSHKGRYLLLGIVAVVIFGSIAYLNRNAPQNFEASVIGIKGTGTVGDKGSPLETSVACNDRESITLKVAGGITGSNYDWTVTPEIAVLKAPGGVVDSFLSGVGNTIQVVNPTGASTLPAQLTVTALPTGAIAGGVNFVLDLAPACVSKLDFITPNPVNPLSPADSPVKIEKISATLTNGTRYEYTSNEISNLNLAFTKTVGTTVSPADPTNITISTDTTNMSIDMIAEGGNVAPIHVPALQDTFTKITKEVAGLGIGKFKLLSSKVYPNTLAVYKTNAGSCTTPGDYLVLGTNYTLNDDFTFEASIPAGETTPAVPPVIMDGITSTETELCVAYDYENPTPIKAIPPLSVASTICTDHKTPIMQGTGSGLDLNELILNIDDEEFLPFVPKIGINESKMIYLMGSTGSTVWGSSAAGILTVTKFSEVSQGALLSNENLSVSEGLNINNFVLPTVPFVTASNCVYTAGENPDLEKCDVSISAPIRISNFDGTNYDVIITPATGNPESGIITGSGEMAGTLTGTVAGMSVDGGQVTATGTLTGTVTGTAIGGVKAEITMLVNVGTITGNGPISLNNSVITSVSGNLAKDTTLQPTNRFPGSDQGSDISNYAVLKGISAGTSTIWATDSTGCLVSYDIEVAEEKIVLQFADATQAANLAPAGSIRLKAFRSTDGSIVSANEITSQAVFKSSNDAVATVDSAGLVTAVSSGTAIITATAPGFPTSSLGVPVNVAKITGMTITLDKDSFNKLNPTERQNAYKSVVLAINNVNAAGQSITVEGQTFALAGASVNAIVTALTTDLGTVANIAVTRSTAFNGVLILRATATNTAVDISTTARAEDVTVLPILSQFTLPSAESFGMEVLGEYDNASTKRLNIRDFKLSVNPVNRLDDDALANGRIEVGIEPGQSNLFAETKDGIKSNTLVVNVPVGPVIEDIRVIGTAPIVRGGRITLSAKLSDIHAISDIKEIKASVVRSTGTTLEAIKADASAVWFSAQTFKDQITSDAPVVSPQSPAQDETDETAAEADIPTLTYNTYELPVTIPQAQALIDGSYKLVLEIIDTKGHTASFVLPIFIGQVTQGDINGDGVINVLDVIQGFRISSGAIQGTPAQIQALDLDGSGSVNIIDIILLFRKINNPSA